MEEEIYRAKDMLREIARCGRPRDCAQKTLIQEQEEKEIRRLRFVLAAGFAARHTMVEAKDNKHGVSDGLQQALGSAEILDLPSAFSSNGDGFAQHNRAAGDDEETETSFGMGGFPDASTLYARYRFFHSIEPDEIPLVEQPYYPDNPGKEARYYQVEAINRAANSLRG